MNENSLFDALEKRLLQDLGDVSEEKTESAMKQLKLEREDSQLLTLENSSTFKRIGFTIPDELMMVMATLYGTLLMPAFSLLDQNRLLKLMDEKGQSLIIIQPMGNQKQEILCLHGYCSCSQFQYMITRDPKHSITCKHLLAKKLGEVLFLIPSQIISNSDFLKKLQIFEK